MPSTHAVYHEAFRIPGIMPCNANSRSMIRETLNLRYTPRLRPVKAQRLRTRVGLASRGQTRQCRIVTLGFEFTPQIGVFRHRLLDTVITFNSRLA